MRASWGADSYQGLKSEVSYAGQPDQSVSYEYGEHRTVGVRAKMGELASRLSGLLRGRDIAGTFGAGGKVDRSIATAHSVTQRADKIANGKIVRAAKHIPIAGRYVGATANLVGMAHSMTELAHDSYGNMATAVQDISANPSGLREAAARYGRDSGGRVAGAGMDSALQAIAAETGIRYERGEGIKEVRLRKLGGFALRALRTGGGSVVEAASGAAKAGAEGARSAVRDEVVRTKAELVDAAWGAAQTGSFNFGDFQSSASAGEVGYSAGITSPTEQGTWDWNVPDTVPADWTAQYGPVATGHN